MIDGYDAWKTGNFGEDSAELKEIFTCDVCGEKIYAGDKYYALGNEIWCEDCMEKNSHFA